MQLRAQAQEARTKLDKTAVASLEVYDAMRLRARVLRGYKGALTRQDIKSMHYKEFFGYARELRIMVDEENEANKEGQRQEGQTTGFGGMPRPQEYTGETFRLI